MGKVAHSTCVFGDRSNLTLAFVGGGAGGGHLLTNHHENKQGDIRVFSAETKKKGDVVESAWAPLS